MIKLVLLLSILMVLSILSVVYVRKEAFRQENPGCDGQVCGGYCTSSNSTCCGGTDSQETCNLIRCKNHTGCRN